MTAQAFLRKLHLWSSVAIFAPLGLVIATGLLLLLKKEFDWIQPPTVRGAAPDAVPAVTLAELFETAKGVPELQLADWRDLDRVDVQPGKGVVKFIAANDWEAQIDTETGEVLQVAFRRSDIIESLHDGTFFAEEAKLWVFLPAGLALLGMWGTGIYLFLLPHAKRAERRRKKAVRAAAAP